MDSPLVCLVYASRSIPPLAESELRSLLEQARSNNERLGITGVLIHGDGRFVQVLEGSDDAVHEVFSRIATDRRHYAVQILADEPLEQRRFAHWSMALRHSARSDLDTFDDRLASALDRAGAARDGKAALQDLLPIVSELVAASAP